MCSSLANLRRTHRFGGSGTTANTFVYILWACLQKPEVVAKLRSELREKYPEPSMVPDYKTCSTLPYLQAVISETLRRYPTIIATLPRTAKKEAFVNGMPVPKGVSCLVRTRTAGMLTKSDNRRHPKLHHASKRRSLPRLGELHPRSLARFG